MNRPRKSQAKHVIANVSKSLQHNESGGLSVNVSNALNEAAHRLTLSEKRIIMFAVAKIDSLRMMVGMKPPELRITAAEFVELYGVSPNTAYEELQSAAKQLYNRSIGFVKETRKGPELVNMRWIGAAHYHKSEGWVEIKFWHEVVPHLTALRSKFTSYKLAQASALRSVYSWRLLELLMQYESTGWRRDDIDAFCDAMDAKASHRANFAQLRRWVIEPAVAELRDKDAWLIDWEPVKAGRKVIALKFKFKRDPQGRLDV